MTMLRESMIEFLTEGLDSPPTIYPVRLPINPDLPALVLRYVSDFSGYVHQGKDGLTRRRVQVDVFGEDHDSTDLLAEQVDNLLAGYRGPWNHGISIGACMKDNEFDVDEPETGVWRRVQDYLLEYNEELGS